MPIFTTTGLQIDMCINGILMINDVIFECVVDIKILGGILQIEMLATDSICSGVDHYDDIFSHKIVDRHAYSQDTEDRRQHGRPYGWIQKYQDGYSRQKC